MNQLRQHTTTNGPEQFRFTTLLNMGKHTKVSSQACISANSCPDCYYRNTN